jgi:hypothetical protein
MAKYSFGYSYNDQDSVEIPELDAFLDDLMAVFERHGAAIGVDSYSEYGKLILVRTAERDDFTGNLDDRGAGIAWLDAAHERYKENYHRRHKAEEEASRQQRMAAVLEKEQQLKEGGVRLSDGVYRLVKDE